MKKKLLFYCQHSIGIGHLIRSFALANSLKKTFLVTLVSGGDFPKGLSIPDGISFVQLSPIGLDLNNNLEAIESDEPIYKVMRSRQNKILKIYNEIEPDVFVSEHFPFGKIQFMGDLLPLLKRIKFSDKPVIVVCSLRDILEPKSMTKKINQDISIKLINEYYSSILVHGDENFITLNKTCPQLSRINVPVYYTGYVTDEKYHTKIDRTAFNEIVLSAGGGKIASPFITKMVCSFKKFGFGEGISLKVITGPTFPKGDWIELQSLVKNEPGIVLLRSVESLTNVWKNAKLSISMGGYNTVMEVICSRIPALIIPYCNESNSEQEIRAIKLQKEGLVETIDFEKLSKEEITEAVKNTLNFNPVDRDLNLNGAENTRLIIEQQCLEYSTP